MFDLNAPFSPAGDQPQAIQTILDSYAAGESAVTLLGATGTGKTFTMANIIQDIQKPTLIVSHNKTLAAQLATEFKHFFPNNAVHYFVSYFDYYQPESYLPQSDMYIEKEATINQEIQMFRLATLASLLTRPDVIVVASASSLYGLGRKEFFEQMSLPLRVGSSYKHKELKAQLIKMQYDPVQSKIEPGMFDFKGEMCDVFSSIERVVYRIIFDEEEIERILILNSDTFEMTGQLDKVVIRPATQYLQDVQDLDDILGRIESEMKLRVTELEQSNLLLEAQRLQKRTQYDIRMIRETGFTNGIENYSPYFDQRTPGEVPYTIFDYFPDDFLMIIDESHMTIPQLKAMPSADRARKSNLINYGFRLPSAIDHRPLRFGELEYAMNRSDTYKPYQSSAQRKAAEKKLSKNQGTWTKKWPDSDDSSLSQADVFRHYDDTAIIPTRDENHLASVEWKRKSNPKTLFVSATPGEYELELTPTIAQQVIRPTGLLDPLTTVYPKAWDYQLLLDSIPKLLKKKPYLKALFESYEGVDEKEIFE